MYWYCDDLWSIWYAVELIWGKMVEYGNFVENNATTGINKAIMVASPCWTGQKHLDFSKRLVRGAKWFDLSHQTMRKFNWCSSEYQMVCFRLGPSLPIVMWHFLPCVHSHCCSWGFLVTNKVSQEGCTSDKTITPFRDTSGQLFPATL